MCKEHGHWCSNCSSEVDEGEYEVLDFNLNMEKGTIESKRTIICSRCGKEPYIQEFKKLMKELKKVKIKKIIIKADKLGFLGCWRCGKRITPEIQSITLTTHWDNNYRRLVTGTVAFCKPCYDSDEKTRKIWQFLASIGKNPEFTPEINCNSFDKCPAAEKGNDGFQCTHIAVFEQMVPGSLKVDKRNDSETFESKYVMMCDRAHPGKMDLKELDGHLQSNPVPVTSKGNAIDNSRNSFSDLQDRYKKYAEKVGEAIKVTKDPGLKIVGELLKEELENFLT